MRKTAYASIFIVCFSLILSWLATPVENPEKSSGTELSGIYDFWDVSDLGFEQRYEAGNPICVFMSHFMGRNLKIHVVITSAEKRGSNQYVATIYQNGIKPGFCQWRGKAGNQLTIKFNDQERLDRSGISLFSDSITYKCKVESLKPLVNSPAFKSLNCNESYKTKPRDYPVLHSGVTTKAELEYQTLVSSQYGTPHTINFVIKKGD
jgi:hypothetical protein